jgi:CubicO group peptidase (beta-lactamase class C family)
VSVPLGGWCDDAFSVVEDAFAANFTGRGEVGAAVSVIVNGRIVVDLFGGWRDAARARPFEADTLVNFYSVGKAFVGLLALQLVDQGLVGLDEPVAAAWPEFAAGDKPTATLRHALCHRAGVPAIRAGLTNDDLWDWERMTSALAATQAWWTPGTRHAYHTNTYGHLIGEVVRRTTGEMPGDRLRTTVGPVGADVWFGVPASELHRCAEVLLQAGDPPTVAPITDHDDDAAMEMLSYFNPPGYSSMGVVNTQEWRTAQVPSTNGHGTALGIAKVYAALLEPGRLLSPELLAEAVRPQSQGFCPILGEETTFGLGFTPASERRPMGPHPGSFGHFGTGGAVGFADPDSGVAFGYVMNHVIPRWQSSRNRALIDAVYRVV